MPRAKPLVSVARADCPPAWRAPAGLLQSGRRAARRPAGVHRHRRCCEPQGCCCHAAPVPAPTGSGASRPWDRWRPCKVHQRPIDVRRPREGGLTAPHRFSAANSLSTDTYIRTSVTIIPKASAQRLRAGCGPVRWATARERSTKRFSAAVSATTAWQTTAPLPDSQAGARTCHARWSTIVPGYISAMPAIAR